MTFNFGKHTLYFDPDHFNIEGTDFKMDSNTSYVEKFIKKYRTSKTYREALLPLKLQCLTNIKDVIGGRYNSYLDLLAGIGISGKIFGESAGDVILNDFCPTCYEILRDNFPNAEIYNADMANLGFINVDFVFADFNNFTFKRYLTEYKSVVDKIFENADKYVLINDCSIFYLKYGQTSYDVYSKILGRTIKNLDEYYLAIKDYFREQYTDWSLVIVEAFKDTSFLLFVKHNDIEGLNVTHNTKQNLKIVTELV